VSGAIVFYIKDRIDYRKLLPETQEKIQEKLRIYDELRNNILVKMITTVTRTEIRRSDWREILRKIEKEEREKTILN